MFFERNVQGETETVMAAGADKKYGKYQKFYEKFNALTKNFVR